MTQILRTTQRITSTGGESFGWESFQGVGSDGAESFGSSITLTGHIVEYDGSEKNQYAVQPDGTLVRTPVVIFMPGDASTVPIVGDRITIDSDRVFFVAEKVIVHGLWYTRASPDHFTLKLKAD